MRVTFSERMCTYGGYGMENHGFLGPPTAKRWMVTVEMRDDDEEGGEDRSAKRKKGGDSPDGKTVAGKGKWGW